MFLDRAAVSQGGPLSLEDRKEILQGLKQSIHELDSYKSRVAEEVAAILRKIFPGTAGDQEESLIGSLRKWVGTLTSDIAQYLEDPQCAGFLTRVMSPKELLTPSDS